MHVSFPSSATRLLRPLALLLGAAAMALAMGPAQKAPAKGPQEPGKNLKVFKGQGLDDESLDGAMDYMGAALGVGCAHCHVRDEAKQAWAFERDDKPAKDVARKMVLLTRNLNKTQFKGEEVITCATCHNGHPKPDAIPPLPVPGAARVVATASSSKDLPTVEALLARWVEGAGGQAALERVSTRVAQGKVEMGGGRTATLEVIHKAPGRMTSTLTSPRGTSRQGVDGNQGWSFRGGKTSAMEPRQLAQAKFEADLALPLHLKQHFPTLQVVGRDLFEGREVVVMTAKAQDGTGTTFSFDAGTGLLVRRLTYTSTPLGRLAQETQWQDYRAVEGVQVPFKVVARGPHGAQVTTFSEIRQGDPVEDGRFVKPTP